MKYLRVTAAPDPAAAPPIFRLIAASDHVREARLLGFNNADERGLTGLLVADGDEAAFREALADTPGLVTADVTATGDGRFYVLATFDPDGASLVEAVLAMLTRDGLVVVTPVVYRDGRAHLRLVGESGAVQAAVTNLPPSLDVTVHEIGQGGFEPRGTGDGAASRLSDRQREAVLAAIEMGYYDQPRGATHETIAARLGCAPSTVSEHLQKAESKLVRGVMAENGYLDAA